MPKILNNEKERKYYDKLLLITEYAKRTCPLAKDPL